MGFSMDKLCHSHSQALAMFFFFFPFFPHVKNPIKSKSSALSFSPSFPAFYAVTALRGSRFLASWVAFLSFKANFFFLRLKGSFSPIKVNYSWDIGLK